MVYCLFILLVLYVFSPFLSCKADLQLGCELFGFKSSYNKIGQLPDARDCQTVLASMRCMGTLTDLDTILHGADGHHEP